MKKTWWKEAVVYQIYPRSFMDSNGDGIGDIRGIISKLDYLKYLGIDVVWLSPVFKSPNDDNGYDISDYRDIMDEFGTLSDWEELLTEMHQRGIKLIMDLIVNHTSDMHPWFLESRKSKENPYRDYYIWRDGKDGGLPNNWESIFSGSVWEYDKKTEQYYMHLFSRRQPDLNWENEKVQEEIFDIVKFWLDKGIDGFRMDAICYLSKAKGLPSVSGEGLQKADEYCTNLPEIHKYLYKLNKQAFSKYDIMTVGETAGVTPETALLYCSEDRDEINMVFHFEHMYLNLDSPLGKWDTKPFSLIQLKEILSRWQVGLNGKGWNSLYLNNHDQPRMVSSFGNDDKFRIESAKMLATMVHTMQGTPYIYQGEEIGMTNVKFDTLDEYRDVETFNMVDDFTKNKGYKMEELMPLIYAKGRDNARTPMQWDSTANGGFSEVTPWMKINPNYDEINVKAQIGDKNSILEYYKELILLRKKHKIIVYGDFKEYEPLNEKLYIYERNFEKKKLYVVLNFSEGNVLFTVPKEWDVISAKYLIGNYFKNSLENANVLNPYEARVYLIE